MSQGSQQLAPYLLTAREKLAQLRATLSEKHARGLPGRSVCNRLTSGVDLLIQELYQRALAELPEAKSKELRKTIALVALGGYGRRQLAPYSDIDLMILHQGKSTPALTVFAGQLTRDIVDAGLTLGHSVRTAEQAVQLAKSDAHVATSLVESRWLTGDQMVFNAFLSQFVSFTQQNFQPLITDALAARKEERARYGQTVYLLEPNIKRSKGALRDVHTLRWLWYYKHQTADPNVVRLRGALSKFDHHRLLHAEEFLLRLRNEMHFHAGMIQDSLHRAEQMRVAEAFHYQGSESLLPVEKMMREYFWHTSTVWNLLRRISAFFSPANDYPANNSPNSKQSG